MAGRLFDFRTGEIAVRPSVLVTVACEPPWTAELDEIIRH